MKFEKSSLPEKNELPLDITDSETHAEGAESTTWKTLVKDHEGQEKLIALKQVRREQFASDEEMQKSKKFYDFLKGFPEFGKFVPDTLYFKARVNPGGNPQAFALQEFYEGRPIDKISDAELYRDAALVHELMDFADAAAAIIQKTREQKMIKPDFGKGPDEDTRTNILGNYLLNPRYSNNIMIGETPNQNGRRVFFVDTGINVGERTLKSKEVAQRAVAGRVQELQLKRWKGKLGKMLAAEGKKS